MGNMSYCRFQNTARDLNDIVEHIHDEDLSEEEKRARIRLIKMCREIVEETEGELP